MTAPVNRYAARIVLRDGVARYLYRGACTDDIAAATLYASSRKAEQAIAGFRAKRKSVSMIADVVDAIDPERSVP